MTTAERLLQVHYPLLARVRAYCAAKTASRPMTVITNVKYSDDKKRSAC